jgi:hypothetical protein
MKSGRVLFCRTSQLAFLCIVACLPVQCAMAEMLDQSQIEENSSRDLDSNSILAQTFTPSANGQLSRVDVKILDHGFSYPWTLSIVDTSGGVPNGATLGSAVSSDHNGWVSVSLESANINLLANHMYGITLQTQQLNGQNNEWCTNVDAFDSASSDLYLRGASWRKLTSGSWQYDNVINASQWADRAFRTYTADPVPEPSSLVLFSAAGLACVAFRIRRQRKAAAGV